MYNTRQGSGVNVYTIVAFQFLGDILDSRHLPQRLLVHKYSSGCCTRRARPQLRKMAYGYWHYAVPPVRLAADPMLFQKAWIPGKHSKNIVIMIFLLATGCLERPKCLRHKFQKQCSEQQRGSVVLHWAWCNWWPNAFDTRESCSTCRDHTNDMDMTNHNDRNVIWWNFPMQSTSFSSLNKKGREEKIQTPIWHVYTC